MENSTHLLEMQSEDRFIGTEFGEGSVVLGKGYHMGDYKVRVNNFQDLVIMKKVK